MYQKVLICEDSFEGILSGVYDAWVVMKKIGKENVKLSCNADYDMELFCEYDILTKNTEYAEKVARSIRNKISIKAYEDVYMTAMSLAQDKANLIFKYLQYGFQLGKKVSECMGFTEVMEVTKISNRVAREYDHIRGFLRFEEICDGLLNAKIKPENDILELLGSHFSDRLSGENFVIQDVGREKTLVHQKHCDYYIMDKLIQADGKPAENMKQKYYEDLWKVFFDTITIETRKNETLQKNNLPLRFRRYMTEFENIKSS